ncbi:MAG TPA: M13 family peptidase [Maribacter sp.]|uniref:M13 family metallopeptidase n=2 Tax=Maribacter TaxID=252356 RepID=UPI000EE82DED|nr:MULTISPECIES: M13 family metallopeptidase [unclassified Maribacter]HAF76668.1 M13 family peptidase [Maribacter sp.]|tara:strand:+ start:201132 stop:203180 length:2049 start_codon:yes stop_codon:yes gene_type:complete
MKKVYLFAAGLVALASCKEEAKPTAEAEKIPGIVLANMDTTQNPKSDFYNYVNGNWMKFTEIPDDRTSWGGFSVLRKSTDDDVLKILATAKESGNYAADTDQAKALAIFDTKLDTAARNKAGISPLEPAFKEIESIKNLKDLQTVLATNAAVSSPFLNIGAGADLNNSSMNAVYLGANGLGLPDRDFYLEEDEKSIEIREEYKKHVSKMLQKLGDSEADANKAADKILALETQLAEPRLNKVERRDARNYNNPRTVAEVDEMMSTIDMKKLISDLGITKKFDTLLVTQLRYTQALDKFLKTTPIEDIKTLIRWDTFNSAAGKLTTEIETANWEFYSKYLRGAKEQRPADERALATVNGTVGEALGQLYVDAKFPPEAKAKAELMIANVIDAFKERIAFLDWMSDSTKTKAIEKLDKFTVKIAYPDKWEDYSTMEVSADKSYFENMTAVNKWGELKNYSEIGEPVDKTEWGMSPQTVNAYFNPLNNEIVFPAAILQPPFYNYTADEAVNYGGIGAVIGHEISHAFDDSGSRFDADGNLKNWWTEADLAAFTERADALAVQYDSVMVLPDVYVNGKFTLGENIGDLGGLLGAYDGLQKYYAENGRPEDIDGFTAEQRFFMSWATVWRTKSRDEALRTQIKTDPHSPGLVRATQPLLNIQAFYDAFDIKEGDDMYLAPEKRVSIW